LHIDAIADQPAPPSTSIANMLLNSCGKIPEEKYLKKTYKMNLQKVPGKVPRKETRKGT